MAETIQIFTFVQENIVDITGNSTEDRVSCPRISSVHLESLHIKPGSMKYNIMTIIV